MENTLEAMAETYFRQSEQIPDSSSGSSVAELFDRDAKTAIHAKAGEPAALLCSSCRKPPTACAPPTFRAAMLPEGMEAIFTITTTIAGRKPRRLSPRLMRAS
jgi:hypothetical protein